MLLEKRERLFLTIIISLLILAVFVLVLTNPKMRTDEPYKQNAKNILVISAGDFKDELDKLKQFYTNKDLHYDVQNFIISLDVSPKDWNVIANVIFDGYNTHDAFVILHNPDTLAYTASGLSFMLENLNKTVVLSTNAILAMRIAQEYKIPEVVVVDGNSAEILRGCRTKRIKSFFTSPSFPIIGKADNNIVINKDLLLIPPTEPFKLLPVEPNKKVMVIKLFPGINLHDMVKDQRIFGIVLETYDEGDIPTDPKFMETIQGLIRSGTIILNVSQTMSIVGDKNGLEQVGVIPCGGMTTEAAFAKLYLIISQLSKYDSELVSKLIKTDMRGENL